MRSRLSNWAALLFLCGYTNHGNRHNDNIMIQNSMATEL